MSAREADALPGPVGLFYSKDEGEANDGTGNLADQAVAAALRYRAQAPVVDGLTRELGIDGGSLERLIGHAAGGAVTPASRADTTAE